MNIHDIYALFMRYFRPRRARAIGEMFPLLKDANCRVLDVGGSDYPWSILDPAAEVIILNMTRPHEIPVDCKWKFEIGDGTKLPYADQSFDLVFSNSVIEHVGNAEQQKRFAMEMLRVGKRIYCQTPNKWFPVEPHLLALLLHWLPFPISRKLTRYFSVWGIVTRPSQEKIDDFLLSTSLLTRSAMQKYFPSCQMKKERVLGLTKSFIFYN